MHGCCAVMCVVLRYRFVDGVDGAREGGDVQHHVLRTVCSAIDGERDEVN